MNWRCLFGIHIWGRPGYNGHDGGQYRICVRCLAVQWLRAATPRQRTLVAHARLILGSVLIAVGIFWAANALAEPMVAYLKDPTHAAAFPPHVVKMRCKPRADVVAMLQSKFGETKKMSGLIGKPGDPLRVLELWSAKSTWTVTETYALGDTLMMCIRMSGRAVHLVPQGMAL